MITTLPLLNPPAPHADPIASGIAQDGHRCGKCISTPRYFKISAKSNTLSPYSRLFLGEHVVERQLRDFIRGANDADCRWAGGVELSSVGVLTPGSWQLYYGSVDSGLGTLVFTGWIAVAIGFASSPAGIDAAVYGVADSQWWNCLEPNVMNHISDDDQGGGLSDLGDTITVQPFWP